MKRVLAFVFALMLVFGVAFADEGRLTVGGSGTVYMQADQASATLGVMMNGDDLAALQASANETVAAIFEALRMAGLEEKDISTNYIYISPRYDYSGEIERIVGYTINNSLTVRTEDMDKIGSYIDAAFAAGANTFDSINFSVKDDSQERNRALELAVKDARSKAEAIAAASGCQLGDVLEISEGSQNVSYYNSASGGAKYAVAESAAMDVGTTVRAAQVNVTANVQITYELK